jgi:hypothetical protein
MPLCESFGISWRLYLSIKEWRGPEMTCDFWKFVKELGAIIAVEPEFW